MVRNLEVDEMEIMEDVEALKRALVKHYKIDKNEIMKEITMEGRITIVKLYTKKTYGMAIYHLIAFKDLSQLDFQVSFLSDEDIEILNELNNNK